MFKPMAVANRAYRWMELNELKSSYMNVKDSIYYDDGAAKEGKFRKHKK